MVDGVAMSDRLNGDQDGPESGLQVIPDLCQVQLCYIGIVFAYTGDNISRQ